MDASVVIRRTIAAPAGATWAAVRAIDGLDRWFPVISSCRVDGIGVGALRVLGLEGGGELHDRVEEIDDEARRFRYLRIEHPFPVTRYVGTVEVQAVGAARAEVTWTIDVEVEASAWTELSKFLFGAITDGLAGLAAEMERVPA